MTSLSEAARKYMGRPFRHRGRDRTLDCAGLGKRAYQDAYGVTLPDFLLYGREPHRDGLVQRTTEALGDPALVAPVRLSLLRVDDLVIMRFEKQPHHIGVLGEHNYGGTVALTLIHADGWNGRVLEQRLTPDMVSRITHVFRRPV